jgi:ribosomal protein L14E/L6E/L27E
MISPVKEAISQVLTLDAGRAAGKPVAILETIDTGNS